MLTLPSCAGGGVTGGSPGTKFVKGTGGIDTVKKTDRQPLPAISGTTLDGDELDLTDYGGKVLVINIWGSWCALCRAEMPHLVKVAGDTRDDGVQFAGINTRDPNKAPAPRSRRNSRSPSRACTTRPAG